jgi:hypothetical protein
MTLRILASLFVQKRVRMSGFSAREVKLCRMKTDGGFYCVTHVHTNKTVVVDVHHASILSVFSPLLFAYYFLQQQACVPNSYKFSAVICILNLI